MLTLRSGSNAIVVAPADGAGVVGWMSGRTAILRRAVPDAVITGNTHVMGWIPLLPYCNRIANGKFSWLGHDYSLTHNSGDSPHTIHGIGWQRRWTVETVTEDRTVLSLSHKADAAWPFSFEAEIDYSLSPQGISVTISLTNRSASLAPAGIGLHPYLAKEHDPALRFNAGGVWMNTPDVLPLRHTGIPPDWDFSELRKVTPMRLDNCFTGWDRTADVDAGPASLRLEADAPFSNLQVFTPSWGDFFCAEPVSHVPNALNRPELPVDQAMDSLPSGATLRGTISLSLTGPAETA